MNDATTTPSTAPTSIATSTVFTSRLRADHPHREVLRAPAVRVAERVLHAADLMCTGAAHHLERGLAETQHAGGADRVRAEDAARRVHGEMGAELLLAAVDDLPPLADVAEAEVLEPHRLEPGERHVHLRHLDLLPRVADARLLVDGLRADATGARAHLVAAWHPHRLRVRVSRLDPRRLPRPLPRLLLRREHEGHGAVRRRTGLEVADRVPEDGRVHHVVERNRLAEVRVLVPAGVVARVHRDEWTDVRRATGARHVGAAARREEAARPRDERRRERQVRRERPHRVPFRLLLPRDGEDAVEEPRADVGHRRQRGGRADRARGVHADERLQVRPERAGEELLGLHDALELIRRLADDDRIDVPVVESRVEERAIDRLAHEARDAQVRAPRGMVRLSDADDGDRPLHVHLRSAPRTKKTFCCRQCPCAAWASARRAPGTACAPARPAICLNTSPRRMRPPIMSGCPQSGPPEGFTAGPPSAARPSVSRSRSSSAGVAAVSSTTSASRALPSPAMASAFPAASRAPALVERSRAPSVCSSIRWSTPWIHAGRSHIFSALPSAARTRQTALSPVGETYPVRSGATAHGVRTRSSALAGSRTSASGFRAPAVRFRAATSARS